ncbi:estradiol 17-beta-dehydrogenase 8-like [Pyrus ussuriensis x Pyrus communis]|uniref:Estradiol 17-beta-dehydrogenase 8-like n=1 Tax=Pyrus ussuriensis x Pyrus communis TaxID=2448454 RepID=A0A5N5HW91_9ROSA|nr:estradiol 17-beta-dehydrogenase 8-like [Pyrus ussuriensis x Pyrus communis]
MENSHQVSDHLEPWRHLHGKVVMVTGASSGLGRDFCLDLAKAGCRIVAAARRIDRLQSVCDQIYQLSITATSFSSSAAADNIPGGGPRAVAVELDVSADGPAIEKSVNKAWDAFGRIDALVNNAGIRGRIIVKISSVAGINGGYFPGATAYNCSKAGVNTLTKTMAMELGVHKIRVNAISPGLFRSEITEVLMQKEWLHNVATKTVPLRTFGTSDPALTSLVRYLLHDSSEYVSGNIYIADAGTTLPGVPIFSSL